MEHMQFKFVEPTMGIFHLKMTILQQLYKSHFGKKQDTWSLHMWMEELGQDYHKMWDDSQKGHIKNFHASWDTFFIVLKGYVFASVATEINVTCVTFSQFTESLQNIPQSKLSDAIEKVIDYCSDFQYVDRMRDAPDESGMLITKTWSYSCSTDWCYVSLIKLFGQLIQD